MKTRTTNTSLSLQAACVAAFLAMVALPASTAVSSAALVGHFSGEHNVASSVNGHSGVLVGTANFGAGYIGCSFVFDGGYGYVSVPDSADWTLGGADFTVSAWVSFASNSPNNRYGVLYHPIVASEEGSGTTNKWILARNGGSLQFHVNGPSTGAQYPVSLAWSPTLHQWHHVAVVRAGTAFTLYVDGAALGTQYSSIVIPDASIDLTFGETQNEFFMQGSIDEVRIYKRALAGSEIGELANEPTSPACIPDSDGDGVPDHEDAFPHDPNEWADSDGDGIGDNADPDDDNDGVPDEEDVFPLDPTEWADHDGDGIGDNADPDDDNDGLSDEQEAELGTDPLSADSDSDGVGDGDEVAIGCDPLDEDTDGDLFADGTEVAAGSQCNNPLSVPAPAGGAVSVTEATRGAELPILDDQEPMF